MMSIHGKPFLYYLLQQYKDHDIVLSVNYLKKTIRNWCKENKIYLEFVEEPEFMGTGGAIRIARPFLEDAKKFAVINGDTYFDGDLNNIYKIHNHRKDVCTVVYAKNRLDNMVRNSGLYIFSQSVFDYIETPKTFIFEDKLEEIPYKIFKSVNTYIDIGTHEGLKYAKESLFLDKVGQNEKHYKK